MPRQKRSLRFLTSRFGASAIGAFAALSLALWATDSAAYEFYSSGVSDTGLCADCHGAFTDNPYDPPSGSQAWSNSLHTIHRSDMLDFDCDVCHDGAGTSGNQVALGSSAGGSGGLDPISCSGCHGRAEDGEGFGSVGFSAGLRQHHWNAGEEGCADCHGDSNPAGATPADESVLPPYYADPKGSDTDHPNMPSDPCNPEADGFPEDYAGSTAGLDNDGDGNYDELDTDCGAATPTPPPSPTPAPPPSSLVDHFLCYKAKRARGAERFEHRVVELSNQFQERRVNLVKTEQFCDAVDKNGEEILDPSAHLTCYRVGRPRSAVTPTVISTDQFGELQLNVRRGRTQLCVPSRAQLVGQPMGTPTAIPTVSPMPTPTPSAPGLDHFELYTARTAPRTQKFEKRDVNLEDPFLEESMTVKLKKPVKLGVPTDKNDEEIIHPSAHLTCYSMRASKFDKRDVEVVNQFGRYRLTLRKPNMLCVPSAKQVVTGE